MNHLEPGDMLDHYRIDAAVAHGGMSVLYKATDLSDGKQVAIKVPQTEMEADPVLPCTCLRDGAQCEVCEDFERAPGGWDGTYR